jgi:hypothetical protein
VRDEPDGYLRSFRSQSITARGSGSSGLRDGGDASEGCNDCGCRSSCALSGRAASGGCVRKVVSSAIRS